MFPQSVWEWQPLWEPHFLREEQKGKRYSLPHSRIMIHQVSAGFQGTAIDIDIQAREILKMNEELARILQRHTGQDLERIKRDIDRDYFMDAEQAVAYGVIDTVIHRDRR